MLKALGVSSLKELFTIVFVVLIFSAIVVTVSGLSSIRNLPSKAATQITLRPTSNGTYHDWEVQNPNSGSHWDKVDDTSSDGDATYIESLGGTRDSFVHAASGITSGSTINSVQVCAVAKTLNASGQNGFNTMIVGSGGVELLSNPFTVSTSYQAPFCWTFSTSPGGQSWTPSSVDSTQIGVYVQTIKTVVTQIYMVVNYTAGAPPANPTAALTVNGSHNTQTVPYNSIVHLVWNCTNSTNGTVFPVGYAGTSGSQDSGNLTSNTQFVLQCKNIPNGTQANDSVQVNVGAAPDTTNPTAPGNLHVTGSTSNSISLAWTASSDNVGVVKYIVHRDGIATGSPIVGNPPGTTFTDSGLPSGANYTYWVRSYDAAGNFAQSASIPGSTLATGGGAGTPASPTANIKADPANVDYNGSSVVTWSSGNSTSCSVNPGNFSGLNGSQTVANLTTTTIFTLTCSGPGGQKESTATVTVDAPAQAPPNEPAGYDPTKTLPKSNKTKGNGGGTPVIQTTPTVSGVVNFLNLNLSLPYLHGKTKLLFVIGGYSYELDATTAQTAYQIDLTVANFPLGKSFDLSLGGQNLLIRKVKVDGGNQIATVDLGELAVGDLNNDNRIDSSDKQILLSSVGRSNGGDVNGDGVTNSFDWAIFLKYNGKQGD